MYIHERSLDIGAIVASLGVFLLYHMAFYGVILSGKASIQLSLNLKNATHWIAKHRDKGDAPSVTLAIQTLRNTLIVATFVGGFAFTYAFDFTNQFHGVGNDLNLQARAIIISTLLFCSFLCWASVIRYANHIGFLIGTLSYELAIENQSSGPTNEARDLNATVQCDSDQHTVEETEEEMAKQKRIKRYAKVDENCRKNIRRLMVAFSLGFRFMFVALPFSFLTVGPIALLSATAGTIIFLALYDFYIID
eukprot:gene35665-43256_t